MKYTNKYIKQHYSFTRNLLVVMSVLLVIGIALVIWGFISASVKVNNPYELEDVFDISGNKADRIARIEIKEISDRISKDKYVGFYLIKDDENTYLAGMDKDTYEDVVEKIEDEGEAYLEGTTLVVIDKDALEDIENYKFVGDDIYLNVGEISYVSVLKSRVQLILGGILSVMSLFMVLGFNSELNKYRKVTSISPVTPEEINNAANDKSSIYVLDCLVTPSWLIATGNGLMAFKYDEIDSLRFVPKSASESNHRIILKASNGTEYEIYKSAYMPDYSFSDVESLSDVIKKHNSSVKFEGLEVLQSNDEDYEDDEDFDDESEE